VSTNPYTAQGWKRRADEEGDRVVMGVYCCPRHGKQFLCELDPPTLDTIAAAHGLPNPGWALMSHEAIKAKGVPA
jgi:hypothetical protein